MGIVVALRRGAMPWVIQIFESVAEVKVKLNTDTEEKLCCQGMNGMEK